MKKILPGLILIFLLLSCGKNELPQGVVAEVGDTQITLDDFKRAYLPILLYSDKKESKASREEILNFLIDQAVLANEARLLELDTVPTLEVLRRTGQKTAFTRILYRDWVKDQVPAISEAELRTAFKQSHTSLLVRHLFVDDQASALAMHHELRTGANWDSLATTTFKESSLAANGGQLGWIKFGEMDPDFEKTAYRLKPGEISRPVQTKFGWHIIKVDERSSEVMLTEYDYSLQRSQLQRIIRERHEQRLADSVVNQIMTNAALVFHPDIAPRVWIAMQEQVRSILNTEDFKESLSPELENFEDKLDPLLDEEMLSFSGTVWTVKDFLKHLPEMNRQLMLSDIKTATAFLVRDEIIYNEGINQNLDKSPEVMGEVKDRENQFLANLYLRYLADNQPVSPAMIKQFYEQYSTNRYLAADSIYIYELLFKSQDAALRVKPTLSTDFRKLAARHENEFQINDLGWFQGARADRADYYHKLVRLPLNTIQGPFERDGAYALILATKRHRHAKPIEEVYETVRLDAQEDRNAKLRLTEVQKLSQKYAIRIDRSKLDSLNWRD
ncbi:MAG: peptidylprolyl isomerase [Candidatus Marinimicrobia bacterium]|nr:peptidylprolyl isomerase [Candidatus Neomarinimicrobiota bacterium]